MEDLKKNLILLSKVAKEKKYAQEYLGLLARRGDIGSIRIGKRWYTTRQWFEEFLEKSQKKKAENVSVVHEVKLEKIERTDDSEKAPADMIKINSPLAVPQKKKIVFPAEEKEETKINVPFIFPESEKVPAVQPMARVQHAPQISARPKISVTARSNKKTDGIQKNIAIGSVGDIRRIGEIGDSEMTRKKIAVARDRNFHGEDIGQFYPQPGTRFRNISFEERNKYAVPYREISFRKKTGVFSPDFSGNKEAGVAIFGHFAFAAGFAIIFFLIAASGYFIYSGGLLKNGKVAGSSDERNSGFSSIKSKSEYFITSAGEKMRESLSVSRVVVQAAKEKQGAVSSE